MPHNPINDIWQFLTANTVDYLAIGPWRFLLLALFWVLLIASIAILLRIGGKIRRNEAAGCLEWRASASLLAACGSISAHSILICKRETNKSRAPMVGLSPSR